MPGAADAEGGYFANFVPASFYRECSYHADNGLPMTPSGAILRLDLKGAVVDLQLQRLRGPAFAPERCVITDSCIALGSGVVAGEFDDVIPLHEIAYIKRVTKYGGQENVAPPWELSSSAGSLLMAICTIQGGHNKGRKYCLQVPHTLSLDSTKLARLLERARSAPAGMPQDELEQAPAAEKEQTAGGLSGEESPLRVEAAAARAPGAGSALVMRSLSMRGSRTGADELLDTLKKLVALAKKREFRYTWGEQFERSRLWLRDFFHSMFFQVTTRARAHTHAHTQSKP